MAALLVGGCIVGTGVYLGSKLDKLDKLLEKGDQKASAQTLCSELSTKADQKVEQLSLKADEKIAPVSSKLEEDKIVGKTEERLQSMKSKAVLGIVGAMGGAEAVGSIKMLPFGGYIFNELWKWSKRKSAE